MLINSLRNISNATGENLKQKARIAIREIQSASLEDINKPDQSGCTPLLFLCSDIIWVKNTEQNAPYKNEVDTSIIYELIMALIGRGADINHYNHVKCTALLLAIHTKNIDLANRLIELGANIHYSDLNGYNALLLAIDSKNIDLANRLIELGADINHYIPGGYNALLLAIDSENIDLANRLIKLGADIHYSDSNGDNALLLAIKNKNIDLANRLIELGADMHQTNWQQESPSSLLSNDPNIANLVQDPVKIDQFLSGKSTDYGTEVELFISRSAHKILKLVSEGKPYEGSSFKTMDKSVVQKLSAKILDISSSKGFHHYSLIANFGDLLPKELTEVINESKEMIELSESYLRGEIEGIDLMPPSLINKEDGGFDYSASEETARYYEKHPEEATNPGSYLHRLTVTELQHIIATKPDIIVDLIACAESIQNNVADKHMWIPEGVKDFLNNYSGACEALENEALDGFESKESVADLTQFSLTETELAGDHQIDDHA